MKLVRSEKAVHADKNPFSIASPERRSASFGLAIVATLIIANLIAIALAVELVLRGSAVSSLAIRLYAIYAAVLGVIVFGRGP